MSQKDWKRDNSRNTFIIIQSHQTTDLLFPAPLRLEHVCVARQRISRFSTTVICFSKARLASWIFANISSFLSSSLSLPDSSWISKFHSCWALRSSASSAISTVALFFWYPPLSSRCFCRLKEFFRLCNCRFDSFGMLVLLLVKCLLRTSFMKSIKELGVSKMQCLKPVVNIVWYN